MECRIYTESLTALMDGELAPQEVETIQQHLVICRSCHAEFESLSYSYSLVNGLSELDSRPDAWRNIESRLRTTQQKRGFLRSLFPSYWIPVGALGALTVVVSSVLWFAPRDDRSEEMHRVLRNYIQQREHELSRVSIGTRVRQDAPGMRLVRYNPFSELENKPKGNPFKVE